MLRDLFSLFPACAGVILQKDENTFIGQSFPRMCGGDPEIESYSDECDIFSPHVRG